MDYPIKEIVLTKTLSTTIKIRANSNEEALHQVLELAYEGKFNKNFKDEPNYRVEVWEEYQEGIINEEVILKLK